VIILKDFYQLEQFFEWIYLWSI